MAEELYSSSFSLSLTFVCSTPLTSSFSLVDAQHKTLPIGMNIFANTISDVPSWLIAYHEYFFFLQWEFDTWDVTVEFSTIWNFCLPRVGISKLSPSHLKILMTFSRNLAAYDAGWPNYVTHWKLSCWANKFKNLPRGETWNFSSNSQKIVGR
mgnify:CR=1 FL=1